MYQTLARAVALGFITEDNLNWDEAITKSEAVTLFIDAVDTAYANSMFVTASEGTSEATNSEGLTVEEAAKAGFVNLKGHRTVGGMRASIYNAMPIEGVEKLVEFMKKFEKENTK